MLKMNSLIIFILLSISPFSSDNFCFMYFCVLVWIHIFFQLLYSLNEFTHLALL